MNIEVASPNYPPYKFLTRNLKMTCEKYGDFKRICIKGLYLKKIAHTNVSKQASQKIFNRPTKTLKIFKTLKNVHLPSITYPPYIHKKFKNIKNLKIIHIDSNFVQNKAFKKLACLLKRLSVSIQVINLDINKGNHKTRKNYYNIAKSIRFLPNLEVFRRYFHFDSNSKHVEKEMMTYSKSISRLRNFQGFVYDVASSEHEGFRRAMRRGLVYPRITGLKMNMSKRYFADKNQFRSFFGAESNGKKKKFAYLDLDDMTQEQRLAYKIIQNEIRVKDQKKNDDLALQKSSQKKEENLLVGEQPVTVSSEFYANCVMREEMKPFYRFELFPDLKVLEIVHEESLFPLGPFVIDGFAALKKLESLKINLYTRSMGSGYIFKGLLRLPLLKKFSLSVPFIKNEEWILLKQFLQSQDNLEALSLNSQDPPSARTFYIGQNSRLENAIKCLKNKSFLKSLELTSNYWSLEAISNGLSHLKMINQLHTLKLTASDDTVTSKTKPLKRVGGICNFIRNQKESLQTLHLYLSLALEARIGTHLAEAFSTTTQLRELGLRFNIPMNELTIRDMFDFFQFHLQKKINANEKIKLQLSNKWNPNIAKALKRLEDLETLIMYSNPLSVESSTEFFIDSMVALPSLEKLQKIDMEIRRGAIFYEKKVINVIQELKSIRNIGIKWKDPEFSSKSLTSEINRINQSHAQRCDLMF